ncbi:glycerophosphoryl diester phosphodiesterase [Vibrio sp. JC009]|uniref:glycerophosphoryl diester phosphodiesterase n=1 Tax=Vibrio sp. JC009 TaxID=2912314 RepID=UPI0023AFDF9B|nr:glycerophosphoryl diester phosphodiesterase [Vibrio sp. JC009]WED22780.1 glycerophosphoryl diester phosphodiesterase [Vibrio sp. JC009]
MKKGRGKKMIMGHRGAAALAPENTLAGVRAAVKAGVSWIEVDTQLSADGVPVITHDASVARCTDGEGQVAELTLRELKKLDAGSWFGPEFSKEPIPTLEELLVFCAENQVGINLELKVHCESQVEALVKSVATVIRQSSFPAGQLLISSFSKGAIEEIKQALPEIRIGYITEEETTDYLQELARLDMYSVHVNQKILTQPMAEAILAAGYELNIWTMNNPEKRNDFEQIGVSNIITDDPSLFFQE